MASLFKFLGILVAGYALYGLATGSIYGRYRMWGRTSRRDEDAWGFWSAIVAYGVLSTMLLFVF